MRFIRRDGTIIDMTPPQVTRFVRCTQCDTVAPYDEFQKGRDFFQKPYISRCVNPECDNRQSPGGASMRMFQGAEHPFVFVRPDEATGDDMADALAQTLHNASEAS